MASKRKHVFKILLAIMIGVILMAFYISYKFDAISEHPLDNVSSTLLIDTKLPIYYIYHINPSKNETYFNVSTLLNNKVEWNFDEPTIIIIGGHCSATTSMCHIINNFNYFVHSGCDLKYFSKCGPIIPGIQQNLKHQKSQQIMRIQSRFNFRPKKSKYYNAKSSFEVNLNWSILPWKISFLNDSQYEECEWTAYMKQLNMIPINKRIEKWNRWQWNNESIDIKSHYKYHLDKTPRYILYPYIAKSIAIYSQQSILIYQVREKMSHIYSRLHKIVCGSNNIECIEECLYRMYKWINEPNYKNYLIPLLHIDQTDKIRNKIVAWFVSYWYYHFERSTNVEGKFHFFDMCPYVNILLWMKQLQVFNNKYSFHRFKIVQFENLIENMQRSVAYYYCFAVYGYELYDNQCVRFFMNNDGQNGYYITKQWNEVNLIKEEKQKEKYEFIWTRDKLYMFKEFESLFDICDNRLYELLQQYPSMILGEFDLMKWINIRKQLKQTMLRSTMPYNTTISKNKRHQRHPFV